VQVTPQMTVFGGAGGRNNEGRMQVDGLNTGAGLGGSGVSTYVADISNAQEVVTTTSGGLGEAEVGGPTLSIIPKSGGNRIAGNAYVSGTGGGMVGSNYTDELKAKGLTTPGKLLKQWDVTYGMGGPIVKDRLWYRVAIRDEGQHRTIPNIYPNLNAGDATKYSYSPDVAHEVRGAESWRLYTVRITAQATKRDKINVHWDEQHPCNGATYDITGEGCRKPAEVWRSGGPARPWRPELEHVAGSRAVSLRASPRAAADLGRDRDEQAAVRGGLRCLPGAVRSLRESRQSEP
jgi:hypothetical protein